MRFQKVPTVPFLGPLSALGVHISFPEPQGTPPWFPGPAALKCLQDWGLLVLKAEIPSETIAVFFFFVFLLLTPLVTNSS